MQRPSSPSLVTKSSDEELSSRVHALEKTAAAAAADETPRRSIPSTLREVFLTLTLTLTLIGGLALVLSERSS